MEQLIIPMGYHADLNLHDTQVAIKTVKDFFFDSFCLINCSAIYI